MSESITNVEDAVRVLGALPVPVGPEQRTPEVDPRIELIRRERTHCEAAQFESEDDRLPHVWGPSQYPGVEMCQRCTVRRDWAEDAEAADTVLLAEVDRLRAQVAALLAERHETNKALDDAVQALRVDRAAMVCRECNAPVMWVEGANDSWWNHTQPAEDGHSIVPRPLLRTSAAASADKLTALLAPSQALREDAAAAPCCHLHKPSCCDPEDCGPCCMACPTCPVLVRQRAEGSCTGCVVDHAPGECGYRPEAGAR